MDTIDILLSGGLVVVGSNDCSAFVGTVAVQGDRILWVAEGDVNAEAETKIDCAGLVVAPGFIDIHTHSDATLLSDARAFSQVTQGVTTEIVGNCGHSCAPCNDPHLLRKYLLGIQDEVEITWRTFDEYLAALEESRPVINVASYVGYGAVRLAVKGISSTVASAEDMSRIGTYLKDALDQGAIGISTGLEYTPGIYASQAELIQLGTIAASRNAVHATHVRNRDWLIEMGVGEVLGVSRSTKSQLQLSHIAPKYGAPDGAVDRVLKLVEWARQDGVDVGFDVIPNEWGPTKVIASLPPWALELPPLTLLKLLGEKDGRESLAQNPFPNWKLVADKKWNELVVYYSEANPQVVGCSIAEISRERGCSPWDCICALLADEGEKMANLMWCGRVSNQQDIDLLVQQDGCMIISDGISVCSDGPLENLRLSPVAYSWAASFIERYATKGASLSLVEAVARLSSIPAKRFRLEGRGELRPGFFADIVLFDAASVGTQASILNPNVVSTGFHAVLVNGKIVLDHGNPTMARPGKVLRRGQ